MRQAVVPSQYLQIALDLATRIAQGELTEGSRIYGRSVLASEYGVSPETIRKALRLLADMKVVDVKPQSGAVVLSADSARRYIENFSEDADIHSLRLPAEGAAGGVRRGEPAHGGHRVGPGQKARTHLLRPVSPSPTMRSLSPRTPLSSARASGS